MKTTKNWLDKVKKTRIHVFFWGLFFFFTFILLKPIEAKSLDFDFDLPFLDKWAHLVIFSSLSFTALLAYSKMTEKRVLILFSLYGLVIEILQYSLCFGRFFELLDLLFDLLGILLGIFVHRKLKVLLFKYF